MKTLTISQQSQLRILANKLNTGVIIRPHATNTVSQLEAGESNPFVEAKLEMLRNYLKGIRPKVSSLKLHVLSDEGSDEHVARKFLQLKSGAELRGIEFSLTLENVRDLVRVTHCQYTGVEFNASEEGRKRTIDRVNAKKGYVSGNVVACTHAINCLKNELIELEDAPFKNNLAGLIECIKKWGGIS